MKYALGLIMSLCVTFACHADCALASKAALNFMNEYTKYNVDFFNKRTKEETDHWVQRNTRLTPNFKKSYKEMVEAARKSDPELGLDFDPIFDAQDYPDNGFKFLTCDEKSDVIRLVGNGWENFKVTVKVIRHENDWLIDGAGVINISEDLRTH